MKSIHLLLLFAALQFPHFLLSQSFQSRGTGGGGALFNPSVNPSNPNEVYLPSDLGGLYHTTGSEYHVVNFQEAITSAYGKVCFTQNNNIRYALLYDEENSLRDKLIKVRNILGELQQIDKSFAAYYEECQSAIVVMQEIAMFAQNYNSRIEIQPLRLEFIRTRIGKLQRLRKKYGTYEQMFEQWRLLKYELGLVENFEKEIERLVQEISEEQRTIGSHALRLSIKRAEIAKTVELLIKFFTQD